ANLERIEQVAIDSDSPQVLLPLDPGKPARVRLNPGLNMFRFRDKPSIGGESSFSYRATFSPIRSGIVVKSDDPALSNESRGLPGDRIANNRATTAIVSRGQQRVLFIDDSRGVTNGHQHLINTLVRRKIRVDAVNAAKLPVEKNDFALFLTNFDLIVMANAPAESFTGDQMEAIRSAVHDQGCGLIMIGGPDAFGPGGYQGTPVEAALPVDCEIKAMKAAGKGGLILIMHASEMAEGNKWQIDIAKLALNRLTPNDMVGIMQYGLGLQNVSWVIPFQEIGDKKASLLAKVDGMIPGDMPDFDPFLTEAVDTLIKPEYALAVKHIILISDGDPQYGANGAAAVRKMGENLVTCTTVGVATHSGAESGKLQRIAAGTKDGKGNPGAYYEPRKATDLPAIYIKESRRVSQSFIYDRAFD
ncbi:MAG: VWA domain-containing protein, partial [Gemmataceae bacterium]